MKKIVLAITLALCSSGCSAKDYPILHPDQQKETAKDYPCGLHSYQYKLEVPRYSLDYDYLYRNEDGRVLKVKKVCCPEGYTPSNFAGSCH